MAEARRKTTIEERIEIVKYCIDHNRNYKETAKLYDVSYSQVYFWVRKYDRDGEDGLKDRRGRHKSDAEVDELERLRRENKRLKHQLEEKDMVVELLKSEGLRKDVRLGKLRNESKYLAIEYFYNHKSWSISWMCKQLSIARSAFYKWKHRVIPEQEKVNKELAVLIKEYDERFSHILRYRRMTAWINHFNQTNYSKNRIHRIMKNINVHARIRKQKGKANRSSKSEQTAENKLARDFYAARPNEKWVTDVTEFKIPNTTKKLYLSVILDLYDRYPVAFVVSGRNDTRLVFKTFDDAIAKNPKAKPLFHSDRGFQYTNRVFQKKQEDNSMTQSMSRVGHCIDNGPIEGFWGILKTEMYQMYEISDEATLRFAIKDYIRFYKHHRLQSRYQYKTPREVREAALNSDQPVTYPIAKNKRIDT
ncbi:IS3 family transposase [Streptococcus sp. 10F2]